MQAIQQGTNQHEVNNRLQICSISEVFMITPREARTDSVMFVHHARHPIEAESIKLVLFHPEAEVAHQEPQDLVGSIVEKPTVPKFVATSCSLVEVEMICSIELVQAVENIFTSMGMNNVQKNGDTHTMSGVNEFLEVLWRTISRTRGKEISDLVAKG